MTPSTVSSKMLLMGALVNMVGAATLPSYNVDPKSVSVSGLSSGGFMAAQLGVAYSGTFQTGFGVFAGGPFDCARNQQYTLCMNNNSPNTQSPNKNLAAWDGNQVDGLSNLQDRQIFLQVGTSDSVVGPNPMNALQSQLQAYATAAKTTYIKRSGQAHVFPTNFDGQGNNQCGSSSSPYIANCGYDGAGEVLKWMYGNLSPRVSKAQGTIVNYDQSGKYGALGMAQTGSLYVPNACQDGKTVCKLHVALHGCLQTMSSIGNKFTVNTGYNEWADTNNLLILYPQGTPDYTLRQAWQGPLPNPNGCWDWVGWYGDNADQKGGVQMAAIVAQVNQITNGFKGQTPSSTSGASTPPSTISSTPAATTTGSGPKAALYAQCGGIGWTGPSDCESGTCKSYSPYYAQCLP